MKLGLQLGYWGAGPPEGVGAMVAEAEQFRLGTSNMQLSCRSAEEVRQVAEVVLG